MQAQEAWLLARPDGFRLTYRQELEALERNGASPSPLLSPEEAVELIERGNRSVGALTYPWVMDSHPDPTGERLVVLRASLSPRPSMEVVNRRFPYDHPEAHFEHPSRVFGCFRQGPRPSMGVVNRRFPYDRPEAHFEHPSRVFG